MKQILVSIMLGVVLLMQGVQTKNFNNIQDAFKESCSIELVIDNQKTTFDNQTQEYRLILSEFEKMIKDSHQMPALGVSLNDLTRQEIKNGVWLQFNFDFVGYNSEMPFSSLLIQINKNFGGFNVIRLYDNVYEGRCFYISLNNTTMDNLYNFLMKI